MGLFDNIFSKTVEKTGGVTHTGGKEGRLYLLDHLPTYSILENGIVVDLKDLWPREATDRRPVTIQFDEVYTIRALEPKDTVPPDMYALNFASYIMKRFSGCAIGADGKTALPESLRLMGQNQADVLQFLKEGSAAYLDGSIPRPPVYITQGTKEQAVNLDGKSPAIMNNRMRVVDTVGVPVIIEGPALFYYVFFNAPNANDLLTAFQDYNVKKRQGQK